MSTISGIFSFEPLNPTLKEAHIKAFGEKNELKVIEGKNYVFCGSSSKITFQSKSEEMPCQDKKSGIIVLSDSIIDNRKELFEKLNASMYKMEETPDSILILDLYKKFADGFIEHLRGDFAFAIYDPVAQKILLGRDQIGARVIYTYLDNNILYFSSRIHFIVESLSKKIDLNDD